MNGFIQFIKGYRSEECTKVEKRCFVTYPLPSNGEKVVSVFEDFVFEVSNTGTKVLVTVKNGFWHERFQGKFTLDETNGLTGYFSPCVYYREVFCILLVDEPGQFDD